MGGFLGSSGFSFFAAGSGPAADAITGTGTADYVAKFTSAHVIADSIIYASSTAVGIGTASPAGLLHIDGGAAITRMIIDADNNVAKILSFRTNAVQRWALRVDGNETGSNVGGDLAVRTYTDAGALLFTPIHIKRSTGNVSINTTTASAYKLNVNGDVRIAGSGGVSLYVDNAIRNTTTAFYIDALNAGGSELYLRYGNNIDRRLLLSRTRSSINSPFDITTLSVSSSVDLSGLTGNTNYFIVGTTAALGSEIRIYNPVGPTYGNLYVQAVGGNFLVGSSSDRSTGILQVTGVVSVLGTTNNTYRWDATSGTPSNTATPAGWVKISVAGTDSWLPYYQ